MDVRVGCMEDKGWVVCMINTMHTWPLPLTLPVACPITCRRKEEEEEEEEVGD